MPYIYSRVDELEGTDKVGSKQCVALVKYYAGTPATATWSEGKMVMSNLSVVKGTAIATFVDGKYASHTSGNHAALYVKQDAGGIYVMDQWANDQTKPKVSMRYIRRKGKNHTNQFIDPSNNADAYSIVE